MSENKNALGAQELAKMLYRADCPPSVELGDYHLGLLDKTRAAQLQGHLAECPHCAKELATLGHYLDTLATQLPTVPEPEQPGRTARVRVFVAQLLQPGTPIYALRGEDDGSAPLMYAAADGVVQISIETPPDPAAQDQRLVLGLVTGMDTAGWQAHLWPETAAGATASVPVDAFGNFAAQGVLPGNYQLILSGAEAEMHVALVVR
jgi:anti-sigma factor RsiW